MSQTALLRTEDRIRGRENRPTGVTYPHCHALPMQSLAMEDNHLNEGAG